MEVRAYLQPLLAFAACLLHAAAPAGVGAADLATLTKWGAPEGTITQQGAYCHALDGQTRLARWTLESLTMEDLAGRATRIDAFAADPSVPAEFRATLAAYQGSGYDRGHLAAAGNYGDQAAKSATFLLSNMAPQDKTLNRGQWRELEAHCRWLVDGLDGRRVWIVTLPVWLPDGEHVRTHTIGRERIWVPTHFAKSVLVEDAGEQPVLYGWLAANREQDVTADYADWSATVDEIETAAGLDLWSGLPNELEAKLEAGQ